MMKRKLISVMLCASMVCTAFVPVMAKDDVNAFDVEGTDVKIFYNLKNKTVEKDGISKNTSDTAAPANPKLYSVEIPAEFNGKTILGIADSGFYNDDDLESVVIDSGVKSIGSKAFAGADNLKAVSIPNSVTEIGSEAFFSCDSLNSVTLGTGIDTIAQYCFKGCKALNNIVIPSNVKTISNSAFEGCKSLTDVTFKGEVKSINNGAFKNTGLKSIDIPDGVDVVNANTFESCSELEKVEIPTSVKKIENAAFKNCSKLKAVYIPDNCKIIADSAFTGCKNVVIYCSKNSFAASFAEKQGIKYVYGKITEDATQTTDSGITVVVNGEVLDCGNAAPVIIESRTLVPLRPIFEALGVELKWDGTTKTITGTKGTNTMKLTVGNTKAYLNGRDITLDVPAQIIDGNTMVPLRFIGDCLGCEINWSQQSKTASIKG